MHVCHKHSDGIKVESTKKNSEHTYQRGPTLGYNPILQKSRSSLGQNESLAVCSRTSSLRAKARRRGHKAFINISVNVWIAS